MRTQLQSPLNQWDIDDGKLQPHKSITDSSFLFKKPLGEQ